MNAMTKNVLSVFAQRIYDIQFAEITNNAKKKAVDMDCRIVSDFLGTGNDNVSHSTPHIIKNCKYWTSDAKALYKFLQESMNISHYQICEVYANHASGDYTLFHHTTKR